MPKALWIAHVNVLDAEKLAAYASAATPVIALMAGVFWPAVVPMSNWKARIIRATSWRSSPACRPRMIATTQRAIKLQLSWEKAGFSAH